MAKEKQGTDPEEIALPNPQSAITNPQYVGPRPAPIISNVPGMLGAHHADEITNPGFIQFVIDTVPAAKGWWAPA
jgi:hypothetical protein